MDNQNGNVVYGWFDDPGQIQPTYDPPRDAPCLYCAHPIHADDVCTHSISFVGEYAARSYFYRTHRSCADTDQTRTALDGFVIGLIQRNGD